MLLQSQTPYISTFIKRKFLPTEVSYIEYFNLSNEETLYFTQFYRNNFDPMYVAIVILTLLTKKCAAIALKNMGRTKKKNGSVTQYATSGFMRNVFTYEINDFYSIISIEFYIDIFWQYSSKKLYYVYLTDVLLINFHVLSCHWD